MITKTKSGRKLAAMKKVFLSLCVISLILSPLGTFTALAIDAPILTAPIDGATVVATDDTPLGIPVFEWEPVAGATKYRFEISNNIGFSTVALFITTEFPRYAPITSSLTKGDWFWHVRVEAPTISAYSNPWSFNRDWSGLATQPVLISPLANQALDFYNTFSWEPVTGAVQYKFQDLFQRDRLRYEHQIYRHYDCHATPTQRQAGQWRLLLAGDPAGSCRRQRDAQ